MVFYLYIHIWYFISFKTQFFHILLYLIFLWSQNPWCFTIFETRWQSSGSCHCLHSTELATLVTWGEQCVLLEIHW